MQGAEQVSELFGAGLVAALELLKDIADKYDGVSYADLFQMASAVAIEVCAGSVPAYACGPYQE